MFQTVLAHTSLSDIALTEDNYLVGCARDVAALAKVSILFYKWNNDASGVATGEAIQWNVTGQAGNWTTNDSGETMAYSGTTTNGYIYYTSKSNTANSIRYVRLTVNSKGQLETPLYNMQIADLDYTVLSAPRIFASPFNSKNFIANGTNSDVHEINFVEAVRGQAAKTATMSLFSKSAAHTDIFKYGSKIYMVAPTSTGVALADITSGLGKASMVTLNSSAIASSSTSNIAAVGVEVPAATRATSDNELALMVIRDGKISKFSTKKDETTEPPVPTPTYNGERAVFAYNLDRTGDNNLKEYYINYTLSDEAEEVTINLINKADNSVTSIAGGKAKGENKVTVPMSELEPKGEYAWEVEVRSKTIPMNGQFFHEAPSKNDARGGVGIVTNPESTAYGYIVTSIGYAQGFALYTPELKKVGSYHANTSPWNASNRSDLYRLGMRDGSVAYASAFSDKGAGFWKFDPENPTAAPTNLSAGTNDGTGCISFNGKVTGTGSPTVAFEGSGEGTRVWTFAEDWPTGNSDYIGIVARWDIGNAEQITNGVSAAYGDFIGKPGALFASTIVCITPYADGVFIAQGRGSGNNAKTCPGFIYTDIYGEQLYNSANDVSIIPTCGGSLAITADGSLLAVSGYRGSNIRLYDVTWNGKVPTLKYKGEIENSAVKASNSETSQLAFDPAGNLYSFCRSTNADESGLHCYALAAENPVTTTPAKAKQTLRGSDVNTGIDEIVIEEKEAPVEWYTLQGVRVDGDNLRPGIYVRKQGKLAKKVLIR